MEVTAEQRDEIVDLYKSGAKIDDIIDKVRVSRATIYYVLRSRGVKTNRVTRTGDPAVGLQDVIKQLVEAERRAAVLLAVLRRWAVSVPTDEVERVEAEIGEKLL